MCFDTHSDRCSPLELESSSFVDSNLILNVFTELNVVAFIDSGLLESIHGHLKTICTHAGLKSTAQDGNAPHGSRGSSRKGL